MEIQQQIDVFDNAVANFWKSVGLETADAMGAGTIGVSPS